MILSEGRQLIPQTAQTTASLGNDPRLNRDTLLIFCVGGVLFALLLPPEFIRFQARFGLFAREMFRHGPSFFPTTYRVPYPDYPGTSIFLAYLVARLFGQVTPLTAILPTSITSALILALTYRIGAIRSRKWGFVAVLLALFTVEFFTASRSIGLDQYVSLATVASFYLVYSADCYGRRRRLAWLPLAWILGFALRGPIGLVLPVAVVCAYYGWNGRFKALILAMVSASVTLAVGLAGLLLAARAQGGEPFMRAVLEAQVTGRIHGRGSGFTYYWFRCLSSYAVSYPLAILVVVCRFRDIRRRRSDDDNLLGSLAVWVLIILVGLSIPTAKKTRYVLALVPALSLIGAYLLVDVSPRGILLKAREGFLRFCSRCPPFVALAVLALFFYARWFQPSWQAHYLGVLGLLALLALFGRKAVAKCKGRPERDVVSLAIGVAVFVVVAVGIASPLSYSLEKSRPFVRQIEALHEATPGTIVFFRVGPDAEDIKFTVNLSNPLEPQFVSSLDPLWNAPGTHYVIAKEKVFRALGADVSAKIQLVARGKLGHRDFVVFTLLKPSAGRATIGCHHRDCSGSVCRRRIAKESDEMLRRPPHVVLTNCEM